MFASVVVNIEAPGLRQPFTYRVPDAMADQLAPGGKDFLAENHRQALIAEGSESVPGASRVVVSDGDAVETPPARRRDDARWRSEAVARSVGMEVEVNFH